MSAATLDISEARKQFSKLEQRLREARVIWITKRGKKAFAVVDVGFLQTVLETMNILSNPNVSRMLQRSIQDISAGRLHDHDEVKRELLK